VNAIVTAVLVLLSVVCAANFLLVIGLARRLREQGEAHAASHAPAPFEASVSNLDDDRDGLPTEGRRVTDLTLWNRQDQPVQLHAALEGRRTVAVVSVGCSACKAAATTLAQAGDERLHKPLIIVEGADEDPETHRYVEMFEAVGEVLRDPTVTAGREAFDLRGYPAFFLMDDAQITAVSYHLPELVARERSLV
jgi:hypothetical protein